MAISYSSTTNGQLNAALLIGSATAIFLLKNKSKRKTLKDGESYPPHVSSWIPFLGSAIDLNKSYTRDFVRKTAQKLDSPVFTATIAGDVCVFIADSKLIPVVYKPIPQIDSLALISRFLTKVIGTAQEDMRHNKKPSTGAIANGHFQRHVMVKEGLEPCITHAQNIIFDLMKEKMVELEQQTSTSSSSTWNRVAMFDFIKQLIFKASMGSLISDALINDQSLKDFCTWEEAVPFLFAGVPQYMCKKAIEARERLVRLLASSQFDERASKLMQDRKEELPVPEIVLVRGNLGVVFAAVGNSMPSVFWTLCHVLSNSEAYDACRSQVEAVASKRENGRSTFTIDELEEMTLLHSAFYECLRMYAGGSAARDVLDDFILNPKEKSGTKYIMEKGTRIMAYPIVAHYDEAIFEDPTTFKYDRFVDPSAKAKDGSLLLSNVRPWGGGVHLCMGRKFIALEAKAMMAMMMMEFDMRMASGEEVPNIDFAKQGISVDHPCRDPLFEVRSRSSTIEK